MMINFQQPIFDVLFLAGLLRLTNSMLMLLRRLLLMVLNPRKLLPLLLPGFLGLLFSTFLFYTTNYHLRSSHNPYWRRTQNSPRLNHNLILIGVMTAEKYLDNRALQIWRSWARKIHGQVIFFVAEGTKISGEIKQSGMPIVVLKGTDDAYPPQKKSFSMIRWMFDNELTNFHWFMRADDDLFVRGDKLKSFLLSLDPEKAHLIGQAGLGNSLEYGQLSLGAQDNYCMGGPGVLLSRETLRQLAPHLQSCLGQLLTTHEDVELGRRHIGLACPWNYEMQTLFHNNASIAALYSGPSTSIPNFLSIRRLITLHPIKQPKIMHRIYLEAEMLRLKEMRQMRMEIVGQLEQIERRRALEGVAVAETEQKEFGTDKASSIDGAYFSGLIPKQPNAPEDLPIWKFISTDSKLLFCVNRPNCPRHTLEAEWRRAINTVIIELFEQFNANARQRGRTLHFQTLQYGHTRVQNTFGVDMILDIALWYRRFRSPNRHPPLAVRRHAYVQQRFGRIKSRHLIGREKPTIHIVVALKGRAETFARFAKNLAELSREDGKIELILVHYSSPENPAIDSLINDTIAQFPDNFLVHQVEMPVQKEFSRGEALSQGAALVPTDSLLFFADVDVLIRKDALDRIRLNTIRNRQVYFPIVFSEFSPRTWRTKEERAENEEKNALEKADHFEYDQRRGYFRHFGFGIVTIYRTDFDAIGGFNLTIQGWGLEDVDLFERIVKKEESTLQIFRAPDPGLVHVFHPIECEAKAGQQQTKAQRDACEGTRAQSMASLDYLAKQLSPYL